MLRLRCSILTQLLSSTATSPVSPLHRLLSAVVSPNPAFAVDDYLVRTCGLTRPQALKASAKLSHLKSPSKPDAVLAFLAGLGLSGADVAALVAKDPKFLCAKVEKTLAPIVAGLTALGLSRSEIARLVLLTGGTFRCVSVVSNVQYCLHLLGSFEDLLRVLKHGLGLLTSDMERVVKPNVAFLEQCGQGVCDIAKVTISAPWVLTTNPQRLPAIVACARGLGVPGESGMFRQALYAVAFLGEDKVAAKVDYLKKAFGWSDAQAATAVSKYPMNLRSSKDMLQSKAAFLISKLGLEPGYIACRPSMLTYSLDRRLRPRCYVVKFLKENGLRDWDYYCALQWTEKVFLEKYISPHKEAAPHLAEDYAAACRGEVPTRFIFA